MYKGTSQSAACFPSLFGTTTTSPDEPSPIITTTHHTANMFGALKGLFKEVRLAYIYASSCSLFTC
jgi:hypothetical protein